MRYQIELGPRMPSTSTSTGFKFLGCLRVFVPPGVQRGHRLVLGLGAGDLDQRHRRTRPRPPPVPFFAPFGAFSAGPSRSASSSSWSRPPAASSMPSHGSPMLGEPLGHRRDGERPRAGSRRPRPTAAASTPGRRAWPAPSTPTRPCGQLGVLVEVDEHALAFLLPPSRGGQVRRAPLDLAGDRLGGQPHLLERPVPLDARVDVEAARARRLRPRGQAVVLEHLAGDQRDVDDLPPVDARHRIEVDPQLVGVVEVVGLHRVRVEVDAAEVDRPRPGRRRRGGRPPSPTCPRRTSARRRRPSRAGSSRVPASGRRPPR